VDIHVTDDRLGGYFRRYQLALRMMTHGARSQTVCAWSGLTRDQLVTQRQRWGFDPDERRRGPAPTALHVFFKSKRHRSEAALFASMCRIVGAIPLRSGKAAAERLPGLENGELLCEALEAFREWRPDAELEFEHAVLLISGVVQAESVALGECSDCHAATLVDGPRRLYTNCGHCQRPATPNRVHDALARENPNDGVIEDHEDPEPEGRRNHGPEREVDSSARNLKSKDHEKTRKQQGAADPLDGGSEE
jgi:hypothetical protein